MQNDNDTTAAEAIDLTQAREAGFAFAQDIPVYNTDMLSDGMDEQEAHDAAFEAWSEAESNKRDFSPFEFTAKALNDASNSEEAWEAFDAGISDAFEAGWKQMLRRYTFNG